MRLLPWRKAKRLPTDLPVLQLQHHHPPKYKRFRNFLASGTIPLRQTRARSLTHSHGLPTRPAWALAPSKHNPHSATSLAIKQRFTHGPHAASQ